MFETFDAWDVMKAQEDDAQEEGLKQAVQRMKSYTGQKVAKIKPLEPLPEGWPNHKQPKSWTRGWNEKAQEGWETQGELPLDEKKAEGGMFPTPSETPDKPEPKQPSDEDAGGGMFPRPGLQKKEVDVHTKEGKTYQATRWVRPEEAKPAAPAPKEPPKPADAAQAWRRKLVTIRRDKLLRTAMAGRLEARVGHIYESGVPYQEPSKTWKPVNIYSTQAEYKEGFFNMRPDHFKSTTGRAYAYEGDPNKVINLHVHGNLSYELRFKAGMEPAPKAAPKPAPAAAAEPKPAPKVDSHDMEVAETILKQFGGGNVLRAMVGARHFTAIKGGLAFALPYHFAKDGINKVRVTLTPQDTYDMEFWKIGPAPGYSEKLMAKHEGIYFDQLQELFEKETALYLNVGKKKAGLPKPHAQYYEETPPELA